MIRTAGDVERPPRTLPSVPPLAMCLAAAAVQGALSTRGTTGSMSRTAGALLELGATRLILLPLRQLRERRTTVDPRSGATPSVLVTDGVFEWTRNPMYLGMAGLLFAHALRRPGFASAIPTALFVLWADRSQIPREEQVLHHVFDDVFADYSRRTSRWFDLRRLLAEGGSRLGSVAAADHASADKY